MEFFNICTCRSYEKNGETKKVWLNCGTIRKKDDGKMFIELNHQPGTTFFVFEQKKKETEDFA